MKILIITQKVDREEAVLGFFHNWLLKFGEKFEKVSVICLEKGVSDLPQHVKVYSLGKEEGRNKIKYVSRFFNYIFGLAREYDAVFVHMNEEYVLLGSWFWRLLGKKIIFWRNHPDGNIFTRIAVLFSDVVLCTSNASFTARFKKTKIMPVGIDTDIFKPVENNDASKTKNKILFLGRIAPIKRPHMLVEALKILKERGVHFEVDFYGDALPKDQNYFNELKYKVKNSGLENETRFFPGVPNRKTPEIYNKHEIFVNLTPSGSFDKTILEAAACGCIPIVANDSLDKNVFENLFVEDDPKSVAEKIEYWLMATDQEKKERKEALQTHVFQNHTLKVLIERLLKQI